MRNAMSAARGAVLAGLLLGAAACDALAQVSSDDAWNPFKWGQEAPRKKQPRALKRVGLEADARRLGAEALFAVWPRISGH